MLIIGFHHRKHKNSLEDFFLSDRKLSTLHVVGSTFSTLIALSFVFAGTAFAYINGISAIWLSLAALLGFVIFAFVSPKIKELSDSKHAITIPELVEHRLGRKFKLISSLIIITIFTLVVATEFLVAGSILTSFLKTPFLPTLIIASALVILYSIIGGFKTVVITDVIQMFLIMLSIPLMFFGLYQIIGGAPLTVPAELLNPFNIGIPVIGSLFLITMLAYFGSQDIFQRVYASRDKPTARKSMLITAVIVFSIFLLTIPLGLLARVAFPSINPNEIIPTLIQQVSMTGLIGLLIAGYLATANSTADTELLTVASNIIRDFKTVKTKNIIAVSRLIMLIIGGVGIAIAALTKDILTLVVTLINLFGILGVIILATLFWKRVSPVSATTSLVTGFGATIVYTIFTGDFLGATLVGLIPTIVLLVALSILVKQKT